MFLVVLGSLQLNLVSRLVRVRTRFRLTLRIHLLVIRKLLFRDSRERRLLLQGAWG